MTAVPTSSDSKNILSLPAIDKLSVDPAASQATNILQATQEVAVVNGDSQDDLTGLMRFIRFDHFEQLQEFPRYPQCNEICTDLEQIDRQNCFIVFISHMWLAGWHGAKDWRGKPHPDNKENKKFGLCREGVAKLFRNLAPLMKECYVWLDFGCIDQDSDACAELRVLDKIVGYCDVILTPIVDDEYEQPDQKCSRQRQAERLMSSNIENEKDAPSGAWRSYLSRAWCRMEMFLASQVPLAEAASRALMLEENQRAQADQRRLKMSKQLGVAMMAGRRPHFYFSTRELYFEDPIVLAPLLNSYLEEFTPAKGDLTKETDRPRVIEFMQKVTPKYQKSTVVSYVGDKNLTTGKREGKGKEVFANGDIFDGLYANDKHTTGVMTYCTFNVYTGDFNELGERHGLGKMEYFFGNTCYGHYENNSLKFGVMEYANGAYYVGDFSGGVRHGIGMYVPMGREVNVSGEIAKNVASSFGDVERKDSCISAAIGVWREDSMVGFKIAEDGDIDDIHFNTMFSFLAQSVEKRPESDVLRQTWHTRDVLKDYNRSKMDQKTNSIDIVSQWLMDLDNNDATVTNDLATLFVAANILTFESLVESVATIPSFLAGIGITVERFGESFTTNLLDKCKRDYMYQWMEKYDNELGYRDYLKSEYLAAFASEGIHTVAQLVEMDLPENAQQRDKFFVKMRVEVTMRQLLMDCGINDATITSDLITLIFAANILTAESLVESVATIPSFLGDIGITAERFGEALTSNLLDKCKRDCISRWMEKNKSKLGYEMYLRSEYLAAFASEGIHTVAQLVEMDLPENAQRRDKFFVKIRAEVMISTWSDEDNAAMMRLLLAQVQEKGLPVVETFRHFDPDGSGYISREVFEAGLSKLGIFDDSKITDWRTQIPKLIKELPTNDDGDLQLSEFLSFLGIEDYTPNVVQRMTKVFAVAAENGASFDDIFTVFATDGTGNMSATELLAGLRKLGNFDEVTIEDAETIIKEFDKDDGNIWSFTAFSGYVRSRTQLVLDKRLVIKNVREQILLDKQRAREKIENFCTMMRKAEKKGTSLEDIFRNFDKDNESGSVSTDVLIAGLRKLPYCKDWSDDDILSLVKSISSNARVYGEITLQDFTNYIEDHASYFYDDD